MVGLVGAAWTNSVRADEQQHWVKRGEAAPPGDSDHLSEGQMLASTHSVTTRTQLECTNVLLEPGFEAGPGSAWSESSSNGWDIVQTDDPRTGSYSAWLGGDHRENGEIWQAASISAEAVSATLIYWYKIDSEDYSGFDYGGLLVNVVEVLGHQFDLCGANSTGDFVLSAAVDLLAFAGTAPEIRWFVSTDENLLSNLYVDDVELEVCFEQTGPDPVFHDDFETGDLSRVDDIGAIKKIIRHTSASISRQGARRLSLIGLISMTKHDLYHSPNEAKIGETLRLVQENLRELWQTTRTYRRSRIRQKIGRDF